MALTTFLVESFTGKYDYMTATIAQGLFELGHMAYGWRNDSSSYLTPHDGQDYDVVIQAIEGTQLQSEKPRIYLQGSDLGIGPEMDNLNYRNLKYDIAFVRDLRATFDERRFVYPINFGVEKRYFCKTRNGYKPLKDRKYDVVFLGGLEKSNRREMAKTVRENFKDKNILIDERIFNKGDDFWTRWTQTFCPHDERYFEALADAKIVLSPMGAGPDCARHWEALASGGVPLIERMPSLVCPPELKSERECVFFENMRDLCEKISFVLGNLERYQKVADEAYRMAKGPHSTKGRATYMLAKCMEVGVF
jgi:hypothetical protein